jgi:acyl carrier protein
MQRVHGYVLGLVIAINGCTSSADPTKAPVNEGDSGAVEKIVRDVIAEIMKVDAAVIQMDKPISTPPLKADELHLIEIVMELEERHGVEISDAALDRYTGRKEGEPVRITPNELASIVREAPKRQHSRKK